MFGFKLGNTQVVNTRDALTTLPVIRLLKEFIEVGESVNVYDGLVIMSTMN